MSEKTPENPQDSEPHGSEPVETPIPDDHRPISAEAIVNAPPTREQPPAQNSDQAYAQAFAQANPQARSGRANTGSTQQHPSNPGNAYPRSPQQGSQPQAWSQQPGYSHPVNSHQPGFVYSNPMPGTVPNGSMPGGAPPRRRKPRPENVAFAPVTGAMPLSDSEATEVPADGPIEWPHSRTGFVGVANLVFSAFLALVWAWIPLGLLFTGIGGIFALGLGVLALVVWILVQQGANVVERYRAELIYGDRIPVPKIARSTRESGFTRFLHNQWLTVRSGSFWRSTAHHYVKMLLGAVVVGGTVAGICGSIVGIFGAINPDGISAGFFATSATGLGRVGIVIGAVIILASSLAILWFAPYLDRALDRSLLTPPRTAALQAEVTELDRARMAGIDAAAAERLRIERDLHDGAQPRLVALSMTLGMAKSKIDTDPERAKELVSEAHTEAKGIVNELRQLARGIHPAVLTDRGLDAAVSALAGRSTIPVEVDVRLEGRIEREAEAVAYFVVAECLTNIAKHSGAAHARVFVAPIEAGVQIVVTDNGRGGARIDRSGRHTGIAGLVDRVEAARGTLNLTSPAGGPTTVVVEVPCAS